MIQVLICPNAFKESLDAYKVAVAIATGLNKSGLECGCHLLPIADGGDGSLSIINHYLNAQTFQLEVNGPMGWHVNANYGWQDEHKTGIIELAEASGIKYLHADQLDPWNATTRGTGQLLRHVIEKGAKEIYLTVGGSASVDGGVGILSALGAKFHHSRGQITQPMTSDLHKITEIDMNEVLKLTAKTKITILCDVTNPLLGPTGAAAVFGPQKGAKKEDVPLLEEGLSNMANIIKRDFGKEIGGLKHAGAAGGVAGVLHGTLGAKLINGGEKILDWAQFDLALDKADVVITGEGKIDTQTQYGKGPGLVAMRAKLFGKYVIGMCGMVDKEPRHYEDFDVVLPILNRPVTMHEAMAKADINLERTAMMVGRFLAKMKF